MYRIMYVIIYCTFCVLFLNCAGASATPSTSGVIKIGIYDNPPKLFFDENNRPKGIFPGLISHIAEKEKWNIQFVPLSFKQGLLSLTSGDIDIMQDVAWSKKRSDLYGFTKETVMVSWGRVFQKKGQGINTLVDLDGKRIAVMDGGIYSEGPDGLKALMSKFELEADFIAARGYKQVLTLVHQGKAHAGVVNRLYGKLNRSLYDIEPTPILISPISIRFAFSRSNPVTPQLITVIDRHLAELKADEHSIYYRLIDEYIREPREIIPRFIKRLLWGLLLLSACFAALWLTSSWQTKRKTAQLRRRDKALKKSEKKFRSIFENLQDVYFDTTLSGVFNRVSPSAEKTLGYTSEELINRSVTVIYHNIDDRWTLIEQLKKKGRVRDYELLCKRKDHSRCWASLNADLYYDDAGTPVGIRGILRDITRQKKTQEELARREERFREMARLLPCGIVEMDADLNITYANRTGLELFGFSAEDLIKGVNAKQVFHPEDLDGAVDRLKQIQQSKPQSLMPAEHRILTTSGRQLNLLWNIHPIVIDGQVSGYRGSLSDITQIKQLQKELIRTQKLESTGMLAGGIAHDFNNILLGLFGSISLAKAELVPSDPAFALLEEAEKSMSRAKNLTTRLLTFAQGGDPVKSAVTIEQVIRETAAFNLSGSNVKLVIEHPESLWQAHADKSQISQVISNLVINARQAMSDGGTLTVKMENAAISEGEYTDMELDKYIKVSIADDGSGISESHLEKIFDPYFTTKTEGSGLGLAVVHSIILKHHGYIYVNSEFGKGTTFVIYLPAADCAAQPVPKQAADTNCVSKGHSLKVLLMDDDPLVITVTCKMLEKLGHQVHTCNDGNEAVRLYTKAMRQGRRFDLAIMDLTIPGGMGGCKAVEQVLEIDPSAVAVVASGYSTDPVLANYGQYGFKAVITKPYTIDKIRQTIDNAFS